ncbi:PIG-L deacetylase family protein [Steroidobacter flavus]|uniref:PIG-L deacetylase family protein n=1 Tax=Steroidobacter flavus TaxID=1842136 RepID=A0ABV8T2U0_9GAMM
MKQTPQAKAAPVLVVAAHPDDEVLGCGGTMALMAAAGHPVHVLMLADGESSRVAKVERGAVAGQMEARNSAADAACAILGCASVEVLSLPDNRLDGVELLDIVKLIEQAVRKHSARIVFTHHAGDVNIDHRIVHDAVIAACRPQPGYPVDELLFFEVPSSTEWRPPGSGLEFNPSWFVDISTTLDRKLAALDAYRSEMRPFPHARSIEAVQALARWRGATVGATAAEAFMLGRKIVRTK